MKKILVLILFTYSIFAGETIWLGRSSRALLMGDAWTALANSDEMTLFYNPASLGGNTEVQLTPFPLKIGITNVLDKLDRFNNIPSDAAGIADKLIGFPLYLEFSAFPGLKMLTFGFNLFATSKFNLALRNKVHPSLNIDYRYDRGFAAGFAFNLIGGISPATGKISTGQRLSIGYGIKFMNRKSLKSNFDLMSTGTLDTLATLGGGATGFLGALGSNEGTGVGHDLGVEYSNGNGSSEIIAGLSVLNIGDIRFNKTAGTGSVAKQDMYVNFGTAFKQDFTFVDYAISLDIKPINQPIPFSRKISAGVMVNLPFFSFFGGWKEGYINYGLETRLLPITVAIGYYSVELGSNYREEEGNRLVFAISFLEANFDIF